MKVAFIFKDVSCTIPAVKDLAEWLRFMLYNNKEDLHFLYRASQEYTLHGGGSVYTKDRWLKRLEKNVNKALEEFNKSG